MKKIFLLMLLACGSQLMQAQVFTLKSKELGGQASLAQVLNAFGCQGKNSSPQLYWEHAPAGTKSFAITLYDEDAPTGSGWWHWLIFDIPATVTELKSDAGNPLKNLAPAGSVQSITDFGQPGYGGPCPPEGHGFHKYTLTLYALKTERTGFDHQVNPAMLGFYLEQNLIEKCSLVFYYKR